ncbi:hypothetical protein QR685DRAFT_555144 [Neurospora intermedia]|uniref:Uncharacterized protein n=1 Tax=Neurospora intermedia TaxID=5142 RepID=A0ABR3D8N6_NEUIN
MINKNITRGIPSLSIINSSSTTTTTTTTTTNIIMRVFKINTKGHHLSQEWDEIVASANESQGAALVEEMQMGDDYRHQAQSLTRGVKRPRSAVGLGDDDDEESGDESDVSDDENYEED